MSIDNKKIETIIEGILSLTILEAAKLVEKLKEEHGIEPASSAVAVAAQAAPVAEVKTHFDVVLKDVDASKKIAVIKEFRAITGQGLKEAKDAVDGASASPVVVASALPAAEAEAMKAKLESAGGSVELK